jgi:hypothetical protein
MEVAAKRIVYLCQDNGDSWETEVSRDQMQDDTEKTGFFLLETHGWFDRADPDDSDNRISQWPGLIERLSERLKPTMPAKCPYCEDGCEKCEEGITQARFASGNLFTRACQNPECGFENGGYITTMSLPSESSGKCIRCGLETNWKHLGDI